MRRFCTAALLLALLLATVTTTAADQPHNLTTSYSYVPLDHFDGASSIKFRVRFLVEETHFKPGGPMIVYTGNEGSIDEFASATGVMWDLAKRVSGLIVFIEERYYGKSLPPAGTAYRYLSHAQILADYVMIITSLQHSYFGYSPSDNSPSPPVVAVGGSYGGMLAAYLQRQHPQLITVAWASSAPVLGFATTLEATNRTSDFYRITESNYHPKCQSSIKEAFLELWGALTDEEARELFRICPGDGDKGEGVRGNLIGYLQRKLSDISELDYPYAVNFTGFVLPGHPVAHTCDLIAKYRAEAMPPVAALRASLQWLVNASTVHPTPCLALDVFDAYTPGLEPGTLLPDTCKPPRYW